MAQLLLPNNIEADTTADAVEVEQNYSVIQQHVNTNLINRDGAVSMAAPLLLFADPTAEKHAATKSYVDAIIPVGVIMPYAGGAAPAGSWKLCNGASLPTGSWPELFAVCQYRYGGSASNFNLPNLTARFPIGVDATDANLNATGKTGGSTAPPLKAHVHSMAHNHGSFASGGQSVTHTHDIDHNHASVTSSSAGAHTHTGDHALHGTVGSASSVVKLPGAGTSATVTDSGGAHTHTIDMPLSSGLVSGGASVTHTHTIDMPSYAGDTASTGTDTVHRPPFLVITYIIKADPV